MCSLNGKVKILRQNSGFQASHLIQLQENWLKENDSNFFDIPEKKISSSKIEFLIYQQTTTFGNSHNRVIVAPVDITVCLYERVKKKRLTKATTHLRFNFILYNTINALLKPISKQKSALTQL